MKRRILTAMLALFLVAGLFVPSAAWAQETDDDERDDNDRGEDLERKVMVDVDDDGVEIELKRETAETEDKVEVSFEFEDAEFEVEYETEEGDNETEDKLEVAFQALAEYRDGNGNGKYDAGEEIVSAWALSDDADDLDTDGEVEWLGATVEDVTADNKTGKKITATARLGDDGTFELRMYVFGDFVDLAGESLEPTSVKFDIVIEEYPFEEDDTALALFLETQSKREVETADDDERDDDEEGVSAPGAGETRLVFTWKGNATVDGNDTDVGSTVFELEEEMEDGETKQERRIALSYARGASILHDPEFKVLGADASGMAPGVALPLALGAVLVAAFVVGRRLRDRA